MFLLSNVLITSIMIINTVKSISQNFYIVSTLFLSHAHSKMKLRFSGLQKISVVVKEEDQQEILFRNWTDTTITVLKKGEEGLPLFSGRIEKLVCHIYFSVPSAPVRLFIQKQLCRFQICLMLCVVFLWCQITICFMDTLTVVKYPYILKYR